MWIESLNTIAKNYLVEHRNEYLDTQRPVDERFLNYMLIYSDSSVHLPRNPEYEAMHLMVKFINNTANAHQNEINVDQSMKLSVTITVLTRLAVRDVEVASAVLPAFTRILKASKNKTIVNNLIVCLTDLCKK